MLDDATYVLPLRRSAFDADDAAELADYLGHVATVVPVIVADGSPPDVRAAHAEAWGDRVRVVAVPAPLPGTNGKVVGILAALQATTAERLVIADDDVRYDGAALERVVELLREADVVVPQNVYSPLPWHARWDSARSLLNRAFGGDFPGTVAVRRSALGPDGYDAGVLFENLELIRTVRARGGRVRWALDLVVTRRPPTARKFVEQRVRQAYDSFAQPGRLAGELALLPVAAGGVAVASRGRGRTAARAGLVAAVLAGVACAEAGRQRAGGSAHFPPTSALWAPLWLAERAVCSWVAVAWRCRGGVPYAGTRLRTAAHSVRELRRRATGSATSGVDGEREAA